MFTISHDSTKDAFIVRCSRDWDIDSAFDIEKQIKSTKFKRDALYIIDFTQVSQLDSSGVILLLSIEDKIAASGSKSKLIGFDNRAKRIYKLSKISYAKDSYLPKTSIFETLGKKSVEFANFWIEFFGFCARSAIVLLHTIVHPSRFR